MLTEDGRPVCGSCGATVRERQAVTMLPEDRQVTADGCFVMPPWTSRPYTTAEYEQTARAGGWRIGLLPGDVHDAICPKCAKPDRRLVTLCAELAASVEPSPGEVPGG